MTEATRTETTEAADMDETHDAGDAGPRRPRPGKHLAFFLSGERYAVDILTVKEIIGLPPITRLPGTPDSVLGVVNLRGSVVPVVDARACLGMPSAEATRDTCVLILELPGQVFGVVVDRVAEVLDLSDDDFCELPDPTAFDNPENLLGLARSGERVTILLDAERILPARDRARVASTA